MASVFLYNLSLQRPSAIYAAIYGNFSDPKAQEIVVSRGKVLELLRVDTTGKVHVILSVEAFGIIRALSPFRMPGGTRDYILMGSDSGKMVILEYDAARNSFVKVQEETFGRSGCRRVVPGQLLAADPRGRAILISALEKQKFAYIINRDASTKLTISSPLETHKSHVITLDIVGVDVGYEHPQFAALEVDYGPIDQDHTGQALHSAQRKLVFYQLDLGLNNIIRVKEIPVPPSAHRLISVVGGDDGPGGVLVCAQDSILHVKDDGEQHSVDVPRRVDVEYAGNDGVLIVAHSTLRTKDDFFVFLQSEHGDLFKVQFLREKSSVKELRLSYFDTVPVANAIAVLRTGFIFCASEIGNHYTYQITSMGDDSSSTTFRSEQGKLCLKPRTLTNLAVADELSSMSPIWDVKVENVFKEETPQLLCLTGSGARSSLKILRQGLTATAVADSYLPGDASAIWTLKKHSSNENDDYIVVTFPNSTTVLGVNENGIEEAPEAGFVLNTRTLHIGLVGDDQMVQVHADGLRRIRADGRSREWKPPQNKKIVCATSNEKQIVVAVSGGDVFYFDADSEAEVEKMNIGAGKDVVALALQPVPHKQLRAKFLAVADSENRVRLYGLERADMWRGYSVTSVPSRVSSLAITAFQHHNDHQLSLIIGTQLGVMLRATVDATEGSISDVRKKLLGNRPVKLSRTRLNGSAAILGISSRSWLLHSHQHQLKCQPLSYHTLDWADSFSTGGTDAVVAISKDQLRIFSVSPGDMFNQRTVPLRYTPRQSAMITVGNSAKQLMVIIESDHNALSVSEKNVRDPADDAMQVDGNDGGAQPADDSLPEAMYGSPRPGAGRWASCIRVVDVIASKTEHVLELDNNEAAISLSCCSFRDHSGETFVCVGTAKDLELTPRRVSRGGFIHVYSLDPAQKRLVLLHKKEVEDVPQYLCAYQGRLLAAVGPVLRIYDLGKRKKQLLRKCEAKVVPNQIVNITVQGERIIVADVQESVFFVRYNRADNSLYVMADDIVPRWVTTQTMLDYNTVAGGDKFGNVFVSRLPERVTQLEDDPTGSRFQWEQQYLNGAPYKLEPVCNYYVGETVTRVVKTALTPGGSEVILYATISGSLGVLLPFASREDVDLFTRLEMSMRTEAPPLSGRDHLAFRSYYFPVKNVLDGELCEQYPQISTEKQHRIAQELEREPSDVIKKLEDLRDSL